LLEIAIVLDREPKLVEAAAEDLALGDGALGDQQMTADQVLRAFIIKEMNGYDYATLAYKLADSINYEKFCGTDAIGRGPLRDETLRTHLDRISSSTIERLHAALTARRRE
jgi:hypothetical protein